MEKINFTDTVVVKKPYVEINGIEYEVQDGTYNGGTDLNSKTFNQLQTNIENAINEVKKNYSTDEKKIGTWINGKPIYQKTFTYTPDVASQYQYQHGISNIDKIISSEAMLQRTNGQFVPLSMIYPNAPDLNTLITWSCGYQITKTDIETWIGSSMFEQMDTTNYGIAVTIQYTKTTD